MTSERRRRLSLDDKKNILEKKKQNLSNSQISLLLNIKIKTIASFLQRNEKSKETPGRKGVLIASDKERIVKYVENKNDATLNEIRQHLFDCAGKTVSVATIFRFLGEEKFTRKRVHFIPITRNLEITIEKRVGYVNEYLRILRINPRINFIFLDESGFNLWLKRNYGRNRTGLYPISLTPASPGKNVSLIQAISRQEVLHFELYKGSINAETFKKFLQVLHSKLPDNAVLIMDNASIHHSDVVETFLSENEIASLFLPPYSPFLNPIEETFSKIKNVVRSKKIETFDSLIRGIVDGIEKITADDLEGYFLHAESFFEKCLRGEQIIQ